MAKVKQKILINNISYGTGSIGIKEAIYKVLPGNIKQGSMSSTLSHLRNCIQNGKYEGEFTVGSQYGYLFKYQDYNVLVDKDVRVILTAYKDEEKNPLHICKPKINKSEIQPLPLDNKPEIKVETKQEVTSNDNTIQIGDLIIDASKINLTDHFIKRCKEKFYITDKNYARKFMDDIILNGEYIGIVKDGDFDKETHVFSRKGNAVFLSLQGDVAITVYESKRIYSPKPKELIKSIIQKRIRKLKREENKIYKRNKLSTLEINKQIADYELLKYRAKSQSKKLAYQAYINGLEELKQQYEVEHLEKAKELNDYTKSMIAFT